MNKCLVNQISNIIKNQNISIEKLSEICISVSSTASSFDDFKYKCRKLIQKLFKKQLLLDIYESISENNKRYSFKSDLTDNLKLKIKKQINPMLHCELKNNLKLKLSRNSSYPKLDDNKEKALETNEIDEFFKRILKNNKTIKKKKFDHKKLINPIKKLFPNKALYEAREKNRKDYQKFLDKYKNKSEITMDKPKNADITLNIPENTVVKDLSIEELKSYLLKLYENFLSDERTDKYIKDELHKVFDRFDFINFSDKISNLIFWIKEHMPLIRHTETLNMDEYETTAVYKRQLIFNTIFNYYLKINNFVIDNDYFIQAISSALEVLGLISNDDDLKTFIMFGINHYYKVLDNEFYEAFSRTCMPIPEEISYLQSPEREYSDEIEKFIPMPKKRKIEIINSELPDFGYIRGQFPINPKYKYVRNTTRLHKDIKKKRKILKPKILVKNSPIHNYAEEPEKIERETSDSTSVVMGTPDEELEHVQQDKSIQQKIRILESIQEANRPLDEIDNRITRISKHLYKLGPGYGFAELEADVSKYEK